MDYSDLKEIERLINYHGIYGFLRITSAILKGKSFAIALDESQRGDAYAMRKVADKISVLSLKLKNFHISNFQKSSDVSGNLLFEKTLIKESDWNKLNPVEFCTEFNIKEADLLNFCNLLMTRTGKDLKTSFSEIKKMFSEEKGEEKA